MSAPAPRRTLAGKFMCMRCLDDRPVVDAALDSNGNLICSTCWIGDPPPQDVEGILAEIEYRLEYERKQERDHLAMRAHSREYEDVCPDCGGRRIDARCPYGCR